MDIREIAKRAKVSTATVSRTINRVPTVNPALAKRVWSVIEELGYYPNTQARALVSGRSRIFGLIISEITNPFFPEIVQVFETIAVQHRYEILLTSTGNDPTRMESAVRRMIERRVEGVAILTFGMEEVLLEDLKLRKVPLVFIDVGPPRPRVSNIRIDYLNGIRQAVQHLAALRHEKIAFITGPLRLKSAMARKQAFLRSMQEIGLEVDPVPIDENTALIERHALAHTRLATAARALWGDVVARARGTASTAVSRRVQVGLASVRSLVPVAVAPSCSAHAGVARTASAGRCQRGSSSRRCRRRCSSRCCW